MTRHLHIICAAAPWPPDNSMAIDIFYKMQALHKAGIKIHLHYFCTNPNCHPTELNKYCESVHPYPCGKQKTNFAGINSRPGGAGNDSIANAVSNDLYPVLFEGINCTGTLQQIAAADRKVVIRMYNDECRYYDHLKKSSGLFFQKIRLNQCAREMKKYEDALPQKNCHYVFSTPGNATSFRDAHPSTNVHYLPLFTPFHTVKSKTGVGSFCLYHGDLSDPCNEKAAIWLLSKVFNDINIPLV
ncbi:MAG: mannosyltransferase, partial [Ferruginibacter sp.]|nr:mannosyltransferase [Chitinophagaceae bacterium]